MNDFDNYQGVGQVSKWLFVCAAMVAVMVMIGGITRMTESGVSITEWNLVSGMIPPLHHGDWLALYTKISKYAAVPRDQSRHDRRAVPDHSFGGNGFIASGVG